MNAAEPLIVAHRGASFDAPENTLPAFELAWKRGADAVEGDFLLSKDGHIVCVHDKKTKKVADQNLAIRATEVSKCETLLEAGLNEYLERLQAREVELALIELPQMIKAIRETAMGEIFADDLEGLDAEARQVVERIVAYLEKKYVGLPMKLAKEAVLEQLRKS